MKNCLLPINRLHVPMLLLLFGLFACQEEQISERSDEEISSSDNTFIFTYKNKEYTEQLEYSFSSPLDVPLPKNEVLFKAMQQPEAAIFMNTEKREIGIFDSVEEAKRSLGISLEGENLLNQRLNNQQESDKRRGLVTLFETSDYNSSPLEDWMTVYIGYPDFIYRDRVADLSAIVVNNSGPTINLDRRVSSIRIANLSSTKWLTALLYENKNYGGRAFILQCPPDLVPDDYSASFRYANFVRAEGEPLIVNAAGGLYIKNDYRCSRGAVVSQGSINDILFVSWNDRIRSVEILFTDSPITSPGCVPF